jgi:hypothetical protein
MNKETAINNFKEQKINRRWKSVDWKSNRLYCEGDYLYSYGHHFCLAKRMIRDDKPFYLLNGDTYSSETSKHQSHVLRAMKPNEHTIVSFTALQTIGANYKEIQGDDILDFSGAKTMLIHWKNDRYYLGLKGNKPFGSNQQGMPIWEKIEKDSEGKIIRKEGYWYILGGVLINANLSTLAKIGDRDFERQVNYKAKIYCGMDERQYFIAELNPDENYYIGTTNEAVKSLMPSRLRNDTDSIIIRQGEWFFRKVDFDLEKFRIEKGLSKTKLNKAIKFIELPRRNDRSSRHVVRALYPENGINEGSTLVTGKVYHKNSFNNLATGQHAIVNLDGWFQFYHNTEVRSVSSQGKVD